MSIKAEFNQYQLESQLQGLHDKFMEGLANIDKTSAVAVPVLLGIAATAPSELISVIAASAAAVVVFSNGFPIIEKYCADALVEINEKAALNHASKVDLTQSPRT